MTDTKTQTAWRIAQAHLPQGETLVWCDTPRGKAGLAAGAGVLVFHGLWLLFVLVWTGLALAFVTFSPDDIGVLFRFFPLFGLPFIIIGVIALRGALRGARGEVYALTTERLMVIQGKRVEEYRANDLRLMQREGGSERGSIGFAHTSIEHGANPTAWLRDINDPARVEALIREHLLPRA